MITIWQNSPDNCNPTIIGSDPGDPFHRPRSDQLMANGITFARAGHSTGLYIALSQYYQEEEDTEVAVLQEFGRFRVRGDCAENAHIVNPSHPVMNLVTDATLSNWSCSIHDLFIDYPHGPSTRDFQPLAILLNDTGTGSQPFPDGSVGTPYILAANQTAIEPSCEPCIPYPGQNLCHPTTACSNTPWGLMCLTRPGFKADGVADDDVSSHWRMDWPGHEHRVAVRPGLSADTLCDSRYTGPEVCKEVSVADCGSRVTSSPSSGQKPLRKQEM